MKNLLRVLRLALQYRLTFVAAVACSLGVALLWGGNIGTVFPIVEVVIRGDSLQQWVNEEIEESGKTSAEKTAKVKQLRAELPKASAEQQAKIRADISLAESRIDAEHKAQQNYRRAKPYIDNYLPADPFQTVALVILFLLVGTTVKDFLIVGNNVLVARLANLSTFQLRNQFYRRTLRLDLATFNEEGTSDLMSRFTHDMQQVSIGLYVLFGKLIREPLKMVACLIGAGLICWRLMVLSLLVAPIAAVLIRWLARTLKRANRKAMEEMANIYASLEETFRGIKIVKAFTSERQERRRFHNRSKQYYKCSMRIARYNSLARPINEIAGIAAISMALLAGAYLVLSQETHLLGIRMCPRPLNVASLLLFYGMLAGVADPVRKFSDVVTYIQRTIAACDRIYGRLDREPAICDPQRPVKLDRHHSELTFEGVDFGYHADRPVLEDVNLRIKFGETVALVGPNGSGKSTLANLIPRFYDPTAGVVRIDGVALPDARLRDVRRQIGMVTQEVLLFDDTIFNNIRYGSPHATREQAIEAARRAQAHEFIENETPNGYDTPVGTMGGRLSGGQRQRIALARAILRDPPIIILDEATSQIDLESEQAIQEVLEEFHRGRTTLMITHRMSILALADRIVVMQSGRILDVGTHEELLSRCALYGRLYQIQFEQPDSDSKGPLAA
ncbi:MAG: ABC transporter ATP-binding protein [Candidatus Nealsonbacteria bacterium]|nr:ABC transporter ATP-binding protein [Candidatus Nealsonbacteria bacterium]